MKNNDSLNECPFTDVHKAIDEKRRSVSCRNCYYMGDACSQTGAINTPKPNRADSSAPTPSPANPSEVSDNHCKDCCCARCWEALGITKYTGKSIPEHIAELVATRDPVPDVSGFEQLVTSFEAWWKESLFTECYHTAQEAFAEGWGASLKFNSATPKPVSIHRMPDGRPIFGEDSPHNIREHLENLGAEQPVDSATDLCNAVYRSLEQCEEDLDRKKRQMTAHDAYQAILQHLCLPEREIGKQPIETAPLDKVVIVAGGIAIQKSPGQWFTGMEAPHYERQLQWQPKWWVEIPTGEEI